MTPSHYPPLNIHFIVEFCSKDLLEDRNFQSVQGLKISTDSSEGKELISYENIILKRAYEPNSYLVEWCMECIKNRKKIPLDFTVKLLNAHHELLSAWKIEKAMPVAWGIDELHAQNTKILIETIEVNPLRFNILDSNGKTIAPTAEHQKPPATKKR